MKKQYMIGEKNGQKFVAHATRLDILDGAVEITKAEYRRHRAAGIPSWGEADGQRQGAVPQPQAGCEVGCEGCGGPRGGDEDGAGAYEQLEAAAGAGCGVERTTGREIKLSPRFFCVRLADT